MSRLCSVLWRCRNNVSISRYAPHRNVSNRKNETVTSVQSYRADNQVSADVRPVGEKIKETAKTTSYAGIIIIGVGVTAAMFYTIFSELFSSKSPNSVYTKAFDRCINDTRIEDSLGAPIKGYGEENRRGRRRRVAHMIYKKGNAEHMRMKFYIKGSRRTATVHVDVREGESGKYEYEYLGVEVDDLRGTVIVLEDNHVVTPSYGDIYQQNI